MNYLFLLFAGLIALSSAIPTTPSTNYALKCGYTTDETGSTSNLDGIWAANLDPFSCEPLGGPDKPKIKAFNVTSCKCECKFYYEHGHNCDNKLDDHDEREAMFWTLSGKASWNANQRDVGLWKGYGFYNCTIQERGMCHTTEGAKL